MSRVFSPARVTKRDWGDAPSTVTPISPISDVFAHNTCYDNPVAADCGDRETTSNREDYTMPLKEKIPNQMLYLALITAEEIIGRNGMRSILNYANLQKFIDNYPPNDLAEEQETLDFTRLMAGLIDLVGERGARAIMFRGGIRGFEIFHEQFPSLMNIEGIKPEEKTDDLMFDEFMRIYGIMVDASVALWGDIFKYYPCEEGAALEISPCQYCVGLKTKEPICNAQVGFQFGILRWILGKEVKVEETHCIAMGDPMCRFVMHRP